MEQPSREQILSTILLMRLQNYKSVDNRAMLSIGSFHRETLGVSWLTTVSL